MKPEPTSSIHAETPMNSKNLATFILAITAPVLFAPPAPAHDDGLPWHSHPSSEPPTVNITMGYTRVEAPGGTGKTLSADLLAHSLDNRAAADPDLFDPKEIIATHANMGEFVEMAEVVRLLVVRAERITDPADSDVAMRLAEDTLNRLPIGKLLTADDFKQDQRYLYTAVLPFDIFLDYLKDVGTPDEILTALEDSAAGC